MPPLPIVCVFAGLPDPRRETENKLHLLTDVLTVATCAVIGGAGTNGSCGGSGLAASEEKIVTETIAKCPTGHYGNGGTDCSLVGVIAHEQGHAFGLPHAADRPGGCTGGPSVMDVWWDYDRGATLCEEDRADLETSGYFH